jgi:type VII secretion-associated serine protease mycosin
MLTPGRLARGRGRQLAACAGTLTVLFAAAIGPAVPASADAVRDSEAWVLAALNVQPAWPVTQGQGVTVAVIDSGVNPDVPDLTGSVTTGPDLTGVHTPVADSNWGKHGTWMASLIAGHGHDNGSGIIGVAPQARVLSIRVITDKGDPNFSPYEHEPAARSQRELAAAIRYAVSHHAGVISMSLGYSLQSQPVRAALQDAYDHNVVVVASAGNSEGQPGTAVGQAPYSFPANYPGVLAVAALTQSGQLAGYSSNNLSVQVAAPGSAVPAQGRDGKYWIVTGTSPACALTAGVAALVKARYQHLTDSQVIDAITSSTTPASRPAGGYNDQVGFGEVNAALALAAAGRIAADGPPESSFAATAHFGGGIAAIPAPPVAPRGRTALVLYCLLGAASLVLVAVAISRLFALRDPVPAEAGEVPPPRVPAGSPGRHAAPRRPEASKPGDDGDSQ